MACLFLIYFCELDYTLSATSLLFPYFSYIIICHGPRKMRIPCPIEKEAPQA